MSRADFLSAVSVYVLTPLMSRADFLSAVSVYVLTPEDEYYILVGLRNLGMPLSRFTKAEVVLKRT